MLPALDYLSWAQRYYPRLRFDLASSGLRPISPGELGEPRFGLDDMGAFDQYRERVAERFGVSPSEVTPTLGASGGIFAVYRALFEPGDEVLIEQPTYEPVVRVAGGLSVRRFPRRREDGYAVIPSVVEEHLSPRTRAVVLTDLHNPSGVAADHDALAEVAERLRRRGALLIVDEVYAGIAGAGRTARRLGANVIAFGSLTKCYGLGWARAGYLLAGAEHVAAVERLTLHLCGVLPPSLPALGAHALGRLDALDGRRHELQAGKRGVVDAWLARHAARLSWAPPHAGSLFGFVHDARGQDTRPALEAAADAHGLLAAAGSFFDEPAGFRLGWTLPREQLEPALALLERALGLGG